MRGFIPPFSCKKIIVFGIIILLLIFAGSFVELNLLEVKADTATNCEDHNVQGYAWSENVGWISFSCENNLNVGGEDPNYGVDIDEETGMMSGHGWSENVGWISFNSSDLQGCPSGDCEAKINTETKKVNGWAKVLNSGEWISLSGTTGEGGDYGIEIAKGEFDGWAWAGETIGWISFNCEDLGVCSQSNYSVTSDLAFTNPEVTFEENREDSYCDKSNPPVWLNWTYDSDGSDPEKMDLQITNKDEFEDNEQCGSSCVFEINEEDYISGGFYVGDHLSFDDDYLARIRVIDEYGAVSDWDEKEFSTQIKYPSVDFSWSPSEFYVNQKVEFKDKTNYYQWDDPSNRTGNINLTWEFPDSALEKTIEGTRQEAEEVANEFGDEGDFEVSLEIETEIKDGGGNSTKEACKKTKSISTGTQLPEWKETY